MNLQKQDDDNKLTRVEDLKKKLFYSNQVKESAAHERGLKQHHIDIGKDWVETAEKNAFLEERERLVRERERAGLATQNALHHNSTQYGHFSAAEQLPEYSPQNTTTNKPINTSLTGNRESLPTENTIGAFLSEKFSGARAAETERKMEAQNVALRYASAKIEKNIYPDIKDRQEVSIAQRDAEVKQEERYHPDIKVFSVGQKRLSDMTIETRHTQNIIEKDVPQKTKAEQYDEVIQSSTIEKKKRFRFGLLFFSIITFVFISTLVYTFYTLKNGKNTISADKIQIQITGPVSVRSGSISDFTVDITNNNTGDLVLSDLLVDYPDGTRSSLDTGLTQLHERVDVGTIKPGETKRRKVSAIFFGEENVKKKINFTYEFNIEDSSTVFNTDKEIGVFIASSPVSAHIVNVTEITNNQDLAFDIEVQSNSEEVVKDILLQVEYPFGYSLTESNIKPTADNNIWNIGDIEPLQKKTIRLKGKLIGTSNIEKNFRFILGVADKTKQQMATVMSTQDQKISIKKPFVLATLALDGLRDAVKIVQYEDQLKGDLIFVNNLNKPLTDIVVEMSIDGAIIDRSSIQASNGFYRSIDDVMFWDKTLEPRLALLNPGEQRELSFNLSILKANNELVRTLRRSKANLVVSIKSKRLNENEVPEEIVSGTSQEMRLESALTLDSGIAYASGPFINGGPFPPQVNKETTYTYVGKISNTANSIKGLIFTAKLPPNATWKNKYSADIPASAVSYSASKREISISLGDIPSGLGIDKNAKEFAFQIGFTPTLTERGQSPKIVISPQIQGVDTFTLRSLISGTDFLLITPKLDIGNIGEGSIE